ncbi:MAG TPA: hypothetical protein VGK17_09140 [Propionicimonas sp.]
MSKSISDQAGYVRAAVHDVVADALATIKAPGWAEVIGPWESEGGATLHRQINGQVREPDACQILDSEPFTAQVYCSLFQVSDGRPAEPSVEMSLEHAWANMTPESARSLAQALIEAAGELDAARAAE